MQSNRLGILAATLMMAGTLVSSAQSLAQAVPAESAMPKVGDMAPDFTLMYFDGNDRKTVKLSDYRGKQNVVLAFYVFAFTGG